MLHTVRVLQNIMAFCGGNTKLFDVRIDGIVIIVPYRVKSRVHASPFTQRVHKYSRNAVNTGLAVGKE